MSITEQNSFHYITKNYKIDIKGYVTHIDSNIQTTILKLENSTSNYIVFVNQKFHMLKNVTVSFNLDIKEKFKQHICLHMNSSI